MSESNARVCQWLDCTNKATKHLVSSGEGRRVVTTEGAPAIAIPMHHKDLCDEHLQPTRDSVGGHVQELTKECSPGCPKGGS